MITSDNVEGYYNLGVIGCILMAWGFDSFAVGFGCFCFLMIYIEANKP